MKICCQLTNPSPSHFGKARSPCICMTALDKLEKNRADQPRSPLLKLLTWTNIIQSLVFTCVYLINFLLFNKSEICLSQIMLYVYIICIKLSKQLIDRTYSYKMILVQMNHPFFNELFCFPFWKSCLFDTTIIIHI